jgi:putative spermidine/putrescine transport system substrate-binding protein/spermidine/putrescine transport system substrate-binding protein
MEEKEQRQAGGEMSWGHRVSLLPLLATVLLAGSCTKKTPTLNLLVWEGYADPIFVKTFEQQHHCKVSASYMGSSDELVAKLRGKL